MNLVKFYQLYSRVEPYVGAEGADLVESERHQSKEGTENGKFKSMLLKLKIQVIMNYVF